MLCHVFIDHIQLWIENGENLRVFVRSFSYSTSLENMPHTPRQKCVECDKSFEARKLREVGDGLLRIFLAVRLSKRINSVDSICQRCRFQFLHWQQKMEGDFDDYNNNGRSGGNFLNGGGNSIRFNS